MKITVIVENRLKETLLHEHGLSLLIEDKKKKYLLDTGSGDMYLQNAVCCRHIICQSIQLQQPQNASNTIV